MELNESLQELGLGKHEVKVYLTLLELGRTNAGPVISATRLHRQLVYAALDKLINAGLVSAFSQKNRKVFQASDPVKVLNFQEKKLLIAKDLLPQLRKRMKQSEDRLEIKTLTGKEDFLRNLEELAKSAARHDGIMRIIGGASARQFYDVLGKDYEKYLEILRRHRVRKYLISPEETSEEFKKKFAKEPGNVLKTMPMGLSAPTYTRMTPEMISIEIYASDIMLVQISNVAIAKGYLEHFSFLWKQAKQFKRL